MTQKELNYTEDLYNHEKLLIDVLNESINLVSDELYVTMFENQIKEHNSLLKKLEKVNGGYRLMNDKLILENALTLTKSLAMLYVNATIESSNKKVTDCMNKGLNDVLNIQQKLYQEMSNDGFYQITNLNKPEIAKILNKLTANE